MVQAESERKAHRKNQYISKLKVGHPIFHKKMCHSRKVMRNAIEKTVDDATVLQIIKIKCCEKYQSIFTKLRKWGATNKIQDCAIQNKDGLIRTFFGSQLTVFHR